VESFAKILPFVAVDSAAAPTAECIGLALQANGDPPVPFVKVKVLDFPPFQIDALERVRCCK